MFSGGLPALVQPCSHVCDWAAISDAFSLTSWKIGVGQVTGLTTGSTVCSQTSYLDPSAALRRCGGG